MKTKTEKLTEQINNLSESELVELNNIYCQNCNIDSEVWVNDDEFFEIFFSGSSPYEALQRAHFGDYNWSHDYVKFNGYGNLESFYSFGVDDLCELPEVIAECAIENESEFSHLLDFSELEEED